MEGEEVRYQVRFKGEGWSDRYRSALNRMGEGAFVLSNNKVTVLQSKAVKRVREGGQNMREKTERNHQFNCKLIAGFRLWTGE